MNRDGGVSSMSLAADIKRYSYKDYISWPKEEKYEIISGIPYDMSPAPSRIHQEISMRLVNEIYNYLKGKKCKVYAAPLDVRLCKEDLTDSEIMDVVQPDITVVCDENKLDDRGIKGVPDLIIEIVSPSSTSLDYVKKLNLYGDYGVLEYWIINPKTQKLLVYKIGTDNSYGEPEIYNREDKVRVGIFEGLTIDLVEIFE
jgi:Uma2 family endonuclease